MTDYLENGYQYASALIGPTNAQGIFFMEDGTLKIVSNPFTASQVEAISISTTGVTTWYNGPVVSTGSMTVASTYALTVVGSVPATNYLTITAGSALLSSGNITLSAGVLNATGAQPASVATTPATAATSYVILSGAGGVTTIATTGAGGIGGAVTVTGGAGGTAALAATAGTGGAGGAITYTTGAGAASAVTGTGTGTGGAGGLLSLVGGVGGATSTSTGVNLGGAGGSLAITAGVGGAAAGGSGNTGGAGGGITLTAGAGGAGTQTGGIGGSVVLTAGAAGSGGTSAKGVVRLAGGYVLQYQTPVTVLTSGTSYTMTAAQVMGFTADTTASGPIAATLPTGTVICAALPGYATGDSWYFTYANPGNQTVTLTTAASGTTLLGTMTIATLNVKSFYCIVTGTNAVSVYSLGSGTY